MEPEHILFGFLGFICVFIILLIFVNSIAGSEGTHVGFVTAVERNINLLWDANIVYFKTSDESTQEDEYCVNDWILKSRLEELARTKERVEIKYQHDFWLWKSECNGGTSIIRDVNKVVALPQ